MAWFSADLTMHGEEEDTNHPYHFESELGKSWHSSKHRLIYSIEDLCCLFLWISYASVWSPLLELNKFTLNLKYAMAYKVCNENIGNK